MGHCNNCGDEHITFNDPEVRAGGLAAVMLLTEEVQAMRDQKIPADIRSNIKELPDEAGLCAVGAVELDPKNLEESVQAAMHRAFMIGLCMAFTEVVRTLNFHAFELTMLGIPDGLDLPDTAE